MQNNLPSQQDAMAESEQKPLTASRLHAISVDVEDYFQVWGFSDVIARDSWDGYQSRVGETTNRVLDLFDEHTVKATFFTLGWVAERNPDLIRDIVARGHELASHGYDHTKVFDQDAETFREDAARTKTILEDISGAEVTGYRAAGFSIDQRTPFAHDVLAECGYLYSSSTHPIAHDHYGDPNAPQGCYNPIVGSEFVEAPVATCDVLGKRMSCAGGGWFRAMPYQISRQLIKQAEGDRDKPLIFYFHPWEIDEGQPRIERASRKSRFRHYININKMSGKLSRLMNDFSWGRIDQALKIKSS